MIAYLDGSIAEKSSVEVVIDVQGVGYQVLIPVSTFDKLGEPGQRVKLLTHHHVREDLMLLFGFYTTEEKTMFKKLLSVSGVGPKLALAILSGSRTSELTRFIVDSDIDALTRLPGVGKKTAQRICLELRDKLNREALTDGSAVDGYGVSSGSKFEEGVIALTSLGFSRAEAEKSISKTLIREPDVTLDELIRLSLKKS